MATMNISLPDKVNEFIKSQVSEGNYNTTDEYFLEKEDQRRKAEAKLEALLLEGLNSGEPVTFTRDTVKEVHQRLAERLAQADKSL
jgi:antitoxin ParD1/3/4